MQTTMTRAQAAVIADKYCTRSGKAVPRGGTVETRIRAQEAERRAIEAPMLSPEDRRVAKIQAAWSEHGEVLRQIVKLTKNRAGDQALFALDRAINGK